MFIIKIREAISWIQVKKCSKTSQPGPRNLEAAGTKTAIPLVSYPGLLDLLSLDIAALFFTRQTSSLRLSPLVYMPSEFKYKYSKKRLRN